MDRQGTGGHECWNHTVTPPAFFPKKGKGKELKSQNNIGTAIQGLGNISPVKDILCVRIPDADPASQARRVEQISS